MSIWSGLGRGRLCASKEALYGTIAHPRKCITIFPRPENSIASSRELRIYVGSAILILRGSVVVRNKRWLVSIRDIAFFYSILSSDDSSYY